MMGVRGGAGGPGSLGSGQHRQRDVRRVRGVVVDIEPAANRAGGGRERFTGTEVPGEPGERSATDLEAYPVPGNDPVRGGKQLEVYRQDPVVTGVHIVGWKRLRVVHLPQLDGPPLQQQGAPQHEQICH